MDSRPRIEFQHPADRRRQARPGPPVATLRLDAPSAYGTSFADVYDRWYADVGSATGGLDALAAFVVERTPSGLVIEVGVGSGRLALPLMEAGLTVVGVDASMAMLRQCPPGMIGVAADMAALPLRSGSPAGPPAVGPTVLCGFNTVFNLQSRQRLRRFLVATADLGATVVIEMINARVLADGPELSTGVSPLPGHPDGLVVSSTSINHSRQIMVGRHLEISDREVVARPWRLRWITVAELDAAGRAAGLELTERYETWTGTSFGPDSDAAISVYRPQ